QSLQAFLGVGEFTAQLFYDGVSAFFQVTGSRIIAKARPAAHHVVNVGSCKILNPWPEGRKCVKIGLYGSNRSLLQHDLGEPDAIWIRPHTIRNGSRRHAPGQMAMMAVVPFEKFAGLVSRMNRF